MLSAPQIGVRHARRLRGVARGDARALERWRRRGRTRSACRRRCRRSSAKSRFRMAALVPRAVDGLLAAGRHVSCDAASHSFLREIPQCWLTGQAAGVAAALAVRHGVAPRAVPVGEVQGELAAAGGVGAGGGGLDARWRGASYARTY